MNYDYECTISDFDYTNCQGGHRFGMYMKNSFSSYWVSPLLNSLLKFSEMTGTSWADWLKEDNWIQSAIFILQFSPHYSGRPARRYPFQLEWEYYMNIFHYFLPNSHELLKPACFDPSFPYKPSSQEKTARASPSLYPRLQNRSRSMMEPLMIIGII